MYLILKATEAEVLQAAIIPDNLWSTVYVTCKTMLIKYIIILGEKWKKIWMKQNI